MIEKMVNFSITKDKDIIINGYWDFGRKEVNLGLFLQKW